MAYTNNQVGGDYIPIVVIKLNLIRDHINVTANFKWSSQLYLLFNPIICIRAFIHHPTIYCEFNETKNT